MKEIIKILPRHRVPIVVKRESKKRKTHEQYVDEVAIKNPNIEVIGQYVDAKTKIMHKCLIHDICWDIIPSNVLRGQGCIKCKSEKTINKNSKTHEQYIEELKTLNPNVIVLDKYINAKTSILHKCIIHNIEWMTKPGIVLQGHGCPQCHSERIGNNLRKGNNQYIEELSKINPNIEVVDEYIGANIPILHRCLIHNECWSAIPSNILKGHGCHSCAMEKTLNSTTKKHEEYLSELLIKNPTIEVVDEYINSNTPITHLCKIHNIYWKTSPSSILRGSGCSQCEKDKVHLANKKSEEQYVNDVNIINPNIVVLESYINNSTPILHKCIIHNIEWKAHPASILHGSGCYECGMEKLKIATTKTNEQYIKELNNVNSNIVVLEKYIGANTPILHKCLIDGYQWYAQPSNILFGKGCPQCKESRGERQVRQWLDNHKIMYNKQYKFDDCQDAKPLPFDFYLPDYNVLIEYDGKQHFEPVEYFGGQESFEKTVKHDNIKNEYCKNNGIQLLRIPYYKNVEEELNNFLFI